MSRTIWLAESGHYEDRDVCGIFATLELAMGHWAGPWELVLYDYRPHAYMGLEGDVSNGEVDIRPYELTDEGAVVAIADLKITVHEDPDPVGRGPWKTRVGTRTDFDQWVGS